MRELSFSVAVTEHDTSLPLAHSLSQAVKLACQSLLHLLGAGIGVLRYRRGSTVTLPAWCSVFDEMSC